MFPRSLQISCKLRGFFFRNSPFSGFPALFAALPVHVFIPGIPKVRDDYEPYIFSDDELDRIFSSADNIKIQSSRTNPYTPLEFPVIIRLLFCCGLRIGETLRLKTSDVDLDKGILHMIHTKGNH